MSTRNLSRDGQALALVVRQLEDLLDLVEVVDPVAELPAPVVPLLVGDVLPHRRATADGGRAVRRERQGRIGEVDERRLGRDPGRVLVRDRGLDLLGVHSPGGPPDPTSHPLPIECIEVYALCKWPDDSAMVGRVQRPDGPGARLTA